ncbi:MAG TPA: polyprenyl synthetase family protein [Thermoplasmata archaeon]|nr:polyprenyl synthetase family protein [Thermoplasmata archaeon]
MSPAVEPAEPSLEALVSETLGAGLAEEVSAVLPVLADDLGAIDARLFDTLHSTYPQLTEAASYACRVGGKRVRPLLMAVADRALGSSSTRAIHSLAAAFQLIHTATLVHDDVIDHAEQRRGRPSLPRAFGLPAAIVAGDFLFVRAFQLASEYPRAIIMRCGEACADLAEGEVLQESARFDLTTGREHYFRVVGGKTAAIVGAALASVAEIEGRGEESARAFEEYGRSLGIAFQLRDDFLDVYGDPDLLGKPRFSDLREGNPTLISLEAYAELSGAAKVEFERLFALRRKQPGDLLRLKELTDGTGAPQRAAEEANRWASRAIDSIARLPSGPYHSLLDQLARGAAARRY